MMRPSSTARFERGEIRSLAKQDRELLHFLIFTVAAVIVGIEVGDLGALDHGAYGVRNGAFGRQRSGGRPRCPDVPLVRGKKGKALDVLAFEETYSSSGQFAHLRCGEVFGLAAANKQDAFCLQPLRPMEQQGFRCLAGDFLGGDQILRYLADGAVAGLQLRLGILFVAVVENADDETLGFQLGRRLRGKNGLHCFLSFKHLSARPCRDPRRDSARSSD